jgi:hypothetical protein
MNEVLKGMDRAEALRKIWISKDDCAIFMHQGKPYCNPLVESQCGQMPMTEAQLTAAINRYFDEQERSKWVEPKFIELATHLNVPLGGTHQDVIEVLNKIDARLRIEAFIRANGGRGQFVVYATWDGEIGIYQPLRGTSIGGINCATRELAEEVLRRFPNELKILIGGK